MYMCNASLLLPHTHAHSYKLTHAHTQKFLVARTHTIQILLHLPLNSQDFTICNSRDCWVAWMFRTQGKREREKDKVGESAREIETSVCAWSSSGALHQDSRPSQYLSPLNSQDFTICNSRDCWVSWMFRTQGEREREKDKAGAF